MTALPAAAEGVAVVHLAVNVPLPHVVETANVLALLVAAEVTAVGTGLAPLAGAMMTAGTGLLRMATETMIKKMSGMTGRMRMVILTCSRRFNRSRNLRGGVLRRGRIR